jgi:HPt (histidine-containing phosphotransfer) domain-containing protein
MNQPLVKRSLAELDTVIEEIVQRNPEWYEEIQQLITELKNEFIQKD